MAQTANACVIDVCCEPKRALTITILDDSPAFDPLTAPILIRSPAQRARRGGWGIFFIKKLMDEVSYAYEGERNRLVMVKKVASHPYKPREQLTLKPVEVTALSDNVWRVLLAVRLDERHSRQVAATLLRSLAWGIAGWCWIWRKWSTFPAPG